MKICFNCQTKEWKNICESISLYLQYCHDIAKDDIRKTWEDNSKNGNPSCDGTEDIIAVPLFEKVDDGEIIPHGLKIIRDLRKEKKYKFNTIFLVLSKQDIPDYLHPEKDMHYYAEGLLGNPKFFTDVKKAVFLGELIYKEKGPQDEKTSYEDIEYMNISNFQELNALESLADLIKEKIKLPPIDKKLRGKYYDTFVEYYECKGKDGGNVLNESEKMLEAAQKIYNELNGIQASSHSDKYELFKAPIPFPIMELINAKEEINNNLTKDGKVEPIKLLLIDNKIDKIKSSDSKRTLIDVIDKFDLKSMFTIEMLGNITCENDMLQFDDLAEGNDNEKVELFDYKEFKNDLKKIFRNKVDGDDNYAIKVYEKITNCNFVLLDFFLNKENTYLAFDFIKDIAKIKNEKQDSSTTWYFITSAVYGSVVNYSQSGLLAEYYESAVVSAGDDPTNKKRQIIFLYKLLTFINARLKNFCNLQETIYNRLLKDKVCKHWDKKEKKCKKNGIDCLEKEMLVVIRRYLNEFNDVKDIFFPNKTEIEKWQDIIESLENVIKQFIWLPEADWYMIQHQIDFINNKLGDLEDKSLKKCEFSFKYILKELEDRSEVY